jgi:hypothetical protein
MKKLLLSGLIVLLVTACGSKKTASTSTPPPPAAPKGKPSIASKVKGMKEYAGLFPIYLDTSNGSAYLLISKAQLNKEFIYFSYTENGVVQVGHNRGIYRDNEIFRLQKSFDYIEFIKENTSFYFDSSNALHRASNANISPSMLVNEEIIAADKDSLYLISADKIFFGENLARIKPVFPPGTSPYVFNLGGLNPKKSKYKKFRNYPENTDIIVEYVFDNPSAFIRGGAEVTDPRAVSIVYQHSFIAVPENDFKARRDDQRVGYFTEQVTDMTSYAAAPYKDIIHRWNLVKKDPEAALSEPVKPITWWIENTTPQEYRETIRTAALSWNTAFEKAGFKNAIQVEIQPDTADWDAGDIRYNVLRWTSSPNPPFGGYGPSFVNPRTGEILGADIMLEFVFLTNRLKSFELLTSTGMAPEQEEFYPAQQHHSCEAGELLHHNIQLGMAALAGTDADPAEKEKFMQQAVYYLILHEMGHTLGLMHNMKASNLWLPSEINDTVKTREIGMLGSVMDYPAINISPDKSKQGDYYTNRPGPYDLWAIEYGYSESLNNPEKEEERLQKILSRSTEKELMFGNDADDMRYPGKGIDPRVMIFDISGDAITYSSERIELLNRIIGGLKDKYVREGESYQPLYQAYMSVISEMANAAGVMSRYIGGVYVERSLIGQKDAKQPYTPVAYKDQKRAMENISRQLLSPGAFRSHEQLFNYLQLQRRGFNFFSFTEDPKIHERALGIQGQVISHILHPNTLKRVSNSQLYGNAYSVNELFADLEKAIFDEDISGDVNTYRVNLQQAYIGRLIAIAGLEKESLYDNISRSAAYASILSIQKKAKANESRGNPASQAHKKFIQHTIAKSLKN